MHPRDRTVPGRPRANQPGRARLPDPGLGLPARSGSPHRGREEELARATRWHSIDAAFGLWVGQVRLRSWPPRAGCRRRRAMPDPAYGSLGLHARLSFDTASGALPVLDGNAAWARGWRVGAGRYETGHVCHPGNPGLKEGSSMPASNGTLDLARDAWIGAAILKDPAHVPASTAASRIASSDLAVGTLAGSSAGGLGEWMDPSLKPLSRCVAGRR